MMDDKALLQYALDCKRESDDAKFTRMEQNKENFEAYHMKHDFSHKLDGQSREVLSKPRMTVEQGKSFFQQSLADLGDFFDIEMRDHVTNEELMSIRPEEAKKLLAYQLEKMNYFGHVGDFVQSGLLGALIITKTHGKMVSKPKFKVKESGKGKNMKKNVEMVDDKTWCLDYATIRPEDYFPDPTGKGLYECETMEMDFHEVLALSEGENAIYDKSAVEQLPRVTQSDAERDRDIARETDTDTPLVKGHRPKVRIMEFWGTILNDQGEIEHENIVMTIANEQFVIRKPTPNPLWHQQSPFTKTPILSLVNSVWPTSLMDAAVKHNHTMVEMLNLILDAAFKKVHSISQIRTKELLDPTQVSNGIPYGTKLQVKSSLPPGAKVMESLDETDVPSEALNVLNLIQQEYNSSSLSSDLRSGVIPDRAVKATEVMEQSNTINSIFTGISKNIEASQIKGELEKGWMFIAQNLDMISKDELVSLFGAERGTEISQLDPQDVFVQSVNGFKFKVFGISQTLSKANDYRKLTTLLQTISGSDVLVEEFLKKYDFGKLLGEIMGALNIDKMKLEMPKNQQAQAGAPNPQGPNGDMASVPGAGAPSMADIMGAPMAEMQSNIGGMTGGLQGGQG